LGVPVATADIPGQGRIARIGAWVYDALIGLGDWVIFAGQTVRWTVRRRPARLTVLTSCHDIGVQSVGVVMITGLFIGMVLAVQSVGEFRSLGMESRLGTVINVSVVKELGPVLAATMLAGRIGSAMAAELATMRISEQIDALSCLGANPIHYLVVPRLIACVVVIPLLTAIADLMGVLGGAVITIHFYQVESHQYWLHSQATVGLWEIGVGLFKSVFFGAAIALISCHRGFKSKEGSQGVGQAATEAFVASFIAILALDFVLAISLNAWHDRLWPNYGSKLF
jgi:phospholipid/cholesterol/gamma-HCH transport system permease protein